MSFRFRRRLRLFPGLYLNVSKSGVSSRIDIAELGTTNAKAFANSASAGGRGLTLNVSSKAPKVLRRPWDFQAQATRTAQKRRPIGTSHRPIATRATPR